MIRYFYELLSPSWAELARMQAQIRNLQSEIVTLRSAMSSAESAAYERAAEVVGLIRAEFASLRDQLANSDVALEADAQADADRLNGLVDELVSVLPAEVPEVSVPDPGQPAELPAEGESV